MNKLFDLIITDFPPPKGTPHNLFFRDIAFESLNTSFNAASKLKYSLYLHPPIACSFTVE